MHSIAWTQKILTFMSFTGECRQQKTHHACTIHEDGMRLLLWLDKETVTYAKISPILVNPRDIAGNTEDKKKKKEEGAILTFKMASFCGVFSNLLNRYIYFSSILYSVS